MIPPNIVGYAVYGAIMASVQMIGQVFAWQGRKIDSDKLAEERLIQRQQASEAADNSRRWQEHMAGRAQEDRLAIERLRHSNKIGEGLWPIEMEPAVYASLGERAGRHPLILTYFPAEFSSDAITRQMTLQNSIGLRDFLNNSGYSSADRMHPVSFMPSRLGGARGDSALHTLRFYAPDIAAAMIQLDRVDNDLNLMAGCFGFAPEGMDSPLMTASTGRVPLGARAVHAIRIEHEKLRAALANVPESKFDTALLGEQAFFNLRLLDLEHATGEKFDGLFQPTTANLQAAAKAAQPGLNLLAAGMADFFYWSRYGSAPRLPSVLPALFAEFPDAIKEEFTGQVLDQYLVSYAQIGEARAADAPRLLLDLATSLIPLQAMGGAKYIADVQEQAIDAFRRQAKIPANLSTTDYARGGCTTEQRAFLNGLAGLWRSLGNEDEAAAVEQRRGYGAAVEDLREIHSR